ncbi:hypothetical protein [Thermococcus sp. JCM 11816]|uniref:hypothetical protein n=1 Tax=Thermococcus sp. (strain JCM 11816 / KS-1) TaxID=1295125 RepID=UPI000A7D315B
MSARNWLEGVLYALGLALSVIRPPIDRAACTVLPPSGEACTTINPFFFALYIGLVMFGSLLIALGHSFKNARTRNGWLGVSSGLGIA